MAISVSGVDTIKEDKWRFDGGEGISSYFFVCAKIGRDGSGGVLAWTDKKCADRVVVGILLQRVGCRGWGRREEKRVFLSVALVMEVGGISYHWAEQIYVRGGSLIVMAYFRPRGCG